MRHTGRRISRGTGLRCVRRVGIPTDGRWRSEVGGSFGSEVGEDARVRERRRRWRDGIGMESWNAIGVES